MVASANQIMPSMRICGGDDDNRTGAEPAPIGGPALRPGFESFVGPHDVATRHGLTMGELARFYQRQRAPGVALEVIPCEGWARGRTFAGRTPIRDRRGATRSARRRQSGSGTTPVRAHLGGTP